MSLAEAKDAIAAIEKRLRDVERNQSWVLGVGTGFGAAGMLLVQLVIKQVFG